jgi:SAM-dependent methyltransferase
VVDPLLNFFDEDWAFDEQLPAAVHLKSSIHFTPVAVARHAAALLAPEPGMRVLDVGSGAGKFCLVAGGAVPHARFTGVEFRPRLVRLATRLAAHWQLPNVDFIHADAFDLDWSVYDGFYFYNPFAEQLYDKVFLLDRTIELAPHKFTTYVAAAGERLARARVGSRVVTYHGFGASPPGGFELFSSEPVGNDRLELWIKTRATSLPA